MARIPNLRARLKISHLRLLDSIGSTYNLTRAAEKISMSQPAVSRLVHEMETIIGAPLFDRMPKGMAPTDLGEVLIRHARQALLELEKAQGEIDELLSGYGGTIRVGAVTAPAIDLAMRAIRAFQSEHERLKIVLEIGTSGPLIQSLLEGEFDFVFARAPSGRHGDKLDARHVQEEQAIFLVRANHPLLGRQEVVLSDAVVYPWVMEPEGSLLRQRVEAEFRHASLPLPTRILSTASLLVNLAAIGQSDTIAVVSGAVLQVVGNDGSFRRLKIAETERNFLFPPFDLIRYKDRALSPSAEALYQKMIELC